MLLGNEMICLRILFRKLAHFDENDVFKFRSVNNIVIAPANTGNDNNNNTAVIKTAQANKGIRSNNIPNTRKFPSVLIKFTAPRIELTPAKCNEKIAKSTELPACAIFLERGG